MIYRAELCILSAILKKKENIFFKGLFLELNTIRHGYYNFNKIALTQKIKLFLNNFGI